MFIGLDKCRSHRIVLAARVIPRSVIRSQLMENTLIIEATTDSDGAVYLELRLTEGAAVR